MALITATVVGVLFGCGVFLVLRRGMFEVLLGLALLSQAVNTLIIVAGGWQAEQDPPYLTQSAEIVHVEGEAYRVSRIDPAAHADPLPHALILTAIVIGFALLSFTMVLMARNFEENGSMEVGEAPPEELLPDE